MHTVQIANLFDRYQAQGTTATHTNDFGKEDSHTRVDSSSHNAGQYAHHKVGPLRFVQSQNPGERDICNLFFLLIKRQTHLMTVFIYVFI